MKRTLLAAFAVSVAVAVIVPGSAVADDGCQNGKVCSWAQPTFTGAKQVEGPINLECIGVTLSQGARSAKNQSTRTLVFFTGGNCALDGSATAILLPDSQNASFATSYSFLVTLG